MTTVAACPNCATEPLENAQFCHGCGSPVNQGETHAEYKQVTVLFADVVHSMDLAAAVGAERLREIMADLVGRSVRVVERYGGTVDKFTGDGIMAVFGAPVALEDHAARACFAALGIQQQASELAAEIERADHIPFSLRVGLNSGEVITGEVASRAFGYTAIGEHVGLAQRMESVAQPGGVMLSESTARLVQDAAVLGEPESVRIKGSEKPVPARRLLGMQTPHPAVRHGESPLIGRRWEIAAVGAILERSIDGAGAVVSLVGPAGIGKSRVVRDITATAVHRGAEVFWAFCESHTSDIPFHAVRQLLRSVGGLSSLDAVSSRERVRARIEGADEQDLVLLDDLLGFRDPDAPLPNIDPDARRRRLSSLIRAAAIARDTPAVYIVEDVHWIDDVSDSMLSDFMTVIPQTHSMVLLTHRPEFHGALSRVPGAQTLTLAPLSASESTALAAELLGSDPSVTELAGLIAARAAGNPFFTEEIVRDLVERGVIGGQRGAYLCASDVGLISVPATLQATIAARIDRLSPSAKRTLCGAAVMGMRFGPDLLTVMGVEPDVDELLQAELVDQVRFTGRTEYAFRHPLIRSVAYESQLKADRATLHRRLADAIAAEMSVDDNAALVAEHLEAAGDLKAAYGWHMRAAAWSHGRDIRAALVSWDRAARLADLLPADDTSTLHMRIAPRTLWCANGFRTNKTISGSRFDELQGLCATAGDKASLALATMGLVGEHLQRGRMVEASRLSSELMAIVESIGDPTLTVGLAVGPMAVKILAGDIGEVLRWSDLVIDLAAGDRNMGNFIVGSPLAMARAIRCTARWWFGRTGWQEDFEQALALARDADQISKAAVLTYTYYNAIGSGVIDVDSTAIDDIDKALHSAERASDDIALALALFGKSNALHQDAQQWELELDLLGRVRDMAATGRFYPSMIPVIDASCAEVMIRRGNRDSITLLRSCLDELYRSGMLAYCTWTTGILVSALTASGTESEAAEAEAAMERLAGQSVLEGSVFRDLVLLRCRALLQRARGDLDGFRNFAIRYLEKARSLGFKPHIAMAEKMVGADGIEPPTAGV
jgi:adenylate cyclase